MLADLQRVLAEALWADSPRAALREAAARAGGLSSEERGILSAVDPDAFDLSGILAKKLRFEQALRGDASLAKSFGAGPEAFTGIFKRYCREVPPRFFTGAEEARAFREFAARAGAALPEPACR